MGKPGLKASDFSWQVRVAPDAARGVSPEQKSDAPGRLWATWQILLLGLVLVALYVSFFGPQERCRYREDGAYECVYYLWHTPWSTR